MSDPPIDADLDGSPPERLFEEFPDVATEKWEAQIRADLGERDYDRTLLWHPTPELTVRPYYRADDLADAAHLHAGTTARTAPPPAAWAIRQDVRVDDVPVAAQRIRDAVDGGVDVVGLVLTHVPDGAQAGRELSGLLRGVDLERVSLHVEAGIRSLARLDEIGAFLSEQNNPPASVTAGYDPMSEMAATGRFASAWMDRAAGAAEERQGRVLRASGRPYHDAGANIVEETALLLGAVSEYLVRLTDAGLSVRTILDRLYLSVAVGSSFFGEIARMRALRLLVAQLVSAFDDAVDVADVPIHATVSRRNMTLYDPHSNLLRATTEAASAVLGGCDVLSIPPFDVAAGGPTDFSCRLARNVHHLLRHEAHLDKVSDPAAGSYYVEVLTDALARSAWTLLQEIEEAGGLVEAHRNGLVADKLTASRHRLLEDVARRRRILVGTNQYPNPDERRLEDARDSAPGQSEEQGADRPEKPAAPLRGAAGTARPGEAGAARVGEAGADIIEDEGEYVSAPLPAFRAGEEIERLRLRTERFAAETGRTPSAAILPVGDAAVRSARATFAAHFLGAAGLQIRTLDGVDDEDAALQAARSMESDLLVVAGPDAVYTPHLIHELRERKGLRGIGLVARPDAAVKADFLLFRGADAVKTLRTVHELIGLEVDR